MPTNPQRDLADALRRAQGAAPASLAPPLARTLTALGKCLPLPNSTAALEREARAAHVHGGAGAGGELWLVRGARAARAPS